ncbi:MAG: hypothetical protein DWP97_14380 [Calditrichaeota bacterium]|nr:MAG: hypothetical protein DWP97_14380 [Calditrichota bacterium]
MNLNDNLIPGIKLNIVQLIIITLAFIVYIFSILPLSDWLIDDAGISFVFSRNLAAGNGLVTQPGMNPIEGYSNFLWVILMAVFYLVGLFEPYITSKIISCILVLGIFILLGKSVKKQSVTNYLLLFITLILIATSASFVIWTTSGLENPLYAFLIVLLWYLILNADAKNITQKQLFIFALISFGILITRPDGIVYILVLPIYLIGSNLYTKSFSFKKNGTLLIMYFLYAAGLIAALLLFRNLYFHDFFPNTYHVKGGPDSETILSIITLETEYLIKSQELLSTFTGKTIWLSFPILFLVWIIIISLKKTDFHRTFLTLLMYCFSLGVYLLLPIDWMGEYRFATPFYLFSAFVILFFFIDLFALTSKRYGKILLLLVGLAFVYSSAQENIPRLQTWHKTKKVSFARIANNYGFKFNNYAEKLNIKNGSFLVPDIGGTLYYSELKIYDLGGLCDPVIAKNRGKNQQKFYDYIFEEIKPTFIHTHGYFTVVSKFDEDNRFSEDYIPINEYPDTYAEKQIGRKIMSGDYIRKDAISSVEELSKIR